MISAQSGGGAGSSIVRFRKKFIEQMFTCPHLVSIAWRQLQTIRFLGQQIKEIETEVEEKIVLEKEYGQLLTVPGIGENIGSDYND